MKVFDDRCKPEEGQGMRVEVRLYAHLVDYLPSRRAGDRVELVLAEGTAVGDLPGHLGIPEELTRSSIFLVNGEHRRPTSTLTEGDVVCILPPIVGGMRSGRRSVIQHAG